MTRSIRAALALTVAALVAGGCYGPFNLTRRLYRWNADMGHDQWEREFIFLLLNFVPVYGTVALADAVAFNSMQFWTGNNPVDPLPGEAQARKPRLLVRGSDELALTPLEHAPGRALELQLVRAGRPAGRWLLVHRPGEPARALDSEGTILMSAGTLSDGRVIVTDAHGIEIAAYPAAPGSETR